MIKLAATVQVAKLERTLRAMHERDIPAAKASAWARAGQKCASDSATEVASSLNVPKWMVNGVGGRGSRIARTKWIKSIDGIIIYFRHRHINPAGTKHKPAKVSTLKSGGVRASRRKYEDAFYRGGAYPPGFIMERGADGRGHIAKIPIERQHVEMVRRTTYKVGPPTFVKRFEHEFGRRIRRRGAS